jgi:hypothetical protein
MNNRLEKFVQEHRDEFDDQSPAPELWDRIRERLESPPARPEEKQETPVRSLPFKRWLAAAAVAALLGLSGWLYYALRQQPVSQPVAGQVHRAPAGTPDTTQPASAEQADANPADILPETAQAAPADGTGQQHAGKTEPSAGRMEDARSEIYYYSKLIEIKHHELKTLQKDEPLLYKQFAGDVNRLDSVYQSLKTQLPQNPNREQLIEAMISNLQLQIGLLNKQLDIIKQIKHSKKSAYEKAYQSV